MTYQRGGKYLESSFIIHIDQYSLKRAEKQDLFLRRSRLKGFPLGEAPPQAVMRGPLMPHAVGNDEKAEAFPFGNASIVYPSSVGFAATFPTKGKAFVGRLIFPRSEKHKPLWGNGKSIT